MSGALSIESPCCALRLGGPLNGYASAPASASLKQSSLRPYLQPCTIKSLQIKSKNIDLLRSRCCRCSLTFTQCDVKLLFCCDNDAVLYEFCCYMVTILLHIMK